MKELGPDEVPVPLWKVAGVLLVIVVGILYGFAQIGMLTGKLVFPWHPTL